MITTWNESSFSKLVDTYGADPRRWPKDLRAGALAYAASNIDAHAALNDAQAVDDMLDAVTLPPPSDDFMARLYDLPERGIRTISPRHLLRYPYWTEGMALAASLMLGLYIGTAQFSQPISSASANESYIHAVLFSPLPAMGIAR